MCEMNENYDQHQDLRTEKGLNMATYRNLWILIIYVKRQLLASLTNLALAPEHQKNVGIE
jgi:hypothetical protein